MRIGAGLAKGRKIGVRKAFTRTVDGNELRPTSAKVREAVFDIIRDRIQGARFLDLYAGTGGVGLEALSRDAAEVVFVESGALRARLIRSLLAEFNLRGRSVVIRAEACAFIRKEIEKGIIYDIIFMDPPYGSEELVKTLGFIGESAMLAEDGIVIAEHFSKRLLSDTFDRLRIKKRYRYGDTTISIYRRQD